MPHRLRTTALGTAEFVNVDVYYSGLILLRMTQKLKVAGGDRDQDLDTWLLSWYLSSWWLPYRDVRSVLVHTSFNRAWKFRCLCLLDILKYILLIL